MSSPPTEADSLTSALSLLGRSFDVMIGANERLQIESLTPRDVAIDVPMGDIGTSDFTRIPEAVELGRRAADGMRDQLSRYSVSEDEYLAWVDSLRRTQAPETRARRGPHRRHGTREPRVRALAAPELRSRRSSDAGGHCRGHRARLCARRLRKRGLPAYRPGRRARARDRAGGKGLGPELLPLRSRHDRLRRRRHVRDPAARSRPHVDERARRAMAQRVAARPTVAAGVRLLPADRRAPAVLRATDLVIPREDRRHLPRTATA